MVVIYSSSRGPKNQYQCSLAIGGNGLCNPLFLLIFFFRVSAYNSDLQSLHAFKLWITGSPFDTLRLFALSW